MLAQALVAHGREVSAWREAHGVKIESWGVDCGGKQWDAVCDFARDSARLCGIAATPMAGRAGRNWNPNVKSAIAGERNHNVLCADRPKKWRWLAFDSDYWRETAQRAWLGEVGTTGALSLFDGEGTRHGEFAAQIAAEKLNELRGCEVHMTHIVTPGDEAGLRRLGCRYTSDPYYATNALFTAGQ